ncbi:hypothetical protein QOT17_017047 [Balamuthia mandrillaris]
MTWLAIPIEIVGWAYFCMWGVCYYPQIWKNWRNQSVLGWSMDFVCYNTFGYACYLVFNLNLYWNEDIRREYREKHHGEEVPVRIQDVIFTIHGFFACLMQLTQIFLYRRNETPLQTKLSLGCKVILLLMAITAVALVIFGSTPAMGTQGSWLMAFTVLGMFKTTASFLKYAPQAWLHFRQKAVTGLSLGYVFLDLGGGICSTLHMILLAIDTHHAAEITGNFPKFLLAVEAILFEILFIIQRYVFYRKNSNEFQRQKTRGVSFSQSAADEYLYSEADPLAIHPASSSSSTPSSSFVYTSLHGGEGGSSHKTIVGTHRHNKSSDVSDSDIEPLLP